MKSRINSAGTASFSAYGRASVAPSPVNRMMAAFAGDFRDGVDINLGVGYVNEETIPRAEVRRAFDTVLDNPDRYRLSLNYGGPDGSPNLIRAVRAFYLKHRIGGLDRRVLDRCGIAVGASGATSILEGIAQIYKPGIVITSDPQYYIYTDYLQRQGFTVVSVPEDGEGVDTTAVGAAVRALGRRARDIRFLYVVTVNNPTCVILSNRRRRALVGLARRISAANSVPVPVFFDRAYEYLVHDPAVPALESGLLHDSTGLVYEIDTLSKILAPALRIGYMVGPRGPLMQAMVQKISDTGFSAPLLNQEAAGWLLTRSVTSQMRRVNAGYRKKARAVAGWIRECLGDEVESVTGGSAGFYFYLTFRDVQTGERSRFFRYLSRTTGDVRIDGPDGRRNPRVVYVPGQFCVNPGGSLVETGKRQMRLSYGYESLERIRAGLRIMGGAIAYAADESAAPRRCAKQGGGV